MEVTAERVRDALAECVPLPPGAVIELPPRDGLIWIACDDAVTVSHLAYVLDEYAGEVAREFGAEAFQTRLDEERAAERVERDRLAEIERARTTLAKRRRERLDESGIPRRLAGYTFDRVALLDVGGDWPAFRADVLARREATLGITDWNGRAAHALRSWSPVDGWAWFAGPVGVGKSTLVGAAAVRALDAGAAVRWITEAGFVDCVLSDRDRVAFEGLRLADVVVIDDFGSLVRPKEWQVQIIERAIVEAYDGNAAILFTANTPVDAPEGRRSIRSIYGDRVASRIRERVRGADHRIVGPSWRDTEDTP